jgi:hypothetical protein
MAACDPRRNSQINRDNGPLGGHEHESPVGEVILNKNQEINTCLCKIRFRDNSDYLLPLIVHTGKLIGF